MPLLFLKALSYGGDTIPEAVLRALPTLGPLGPSLESWPC